MSPPVLLFSSQGLTIVFSQLGDRFETVRLLRYQGTLGKVRQRVDQVVLMSKALDVLKETDFRHISERVLNSANRQRRSYLANTIYILSSNIAGHANNALSSLLNARGDAMVSMFVCALLHCADWVSVEFSPRLSMWAKRSCYTRHLGKTV